MTEDVAAAHTFETRPETAKPKHTHWVHWHVCGLEEQALDYNQYKLHQNHQIWRRRPAGEGNSVQTREWRRAQQQHDFKYTKVMHRSAGQGHTTTHAVENALHKAKSSGVRTRGSKKVSRRSEAKPKHTHKQQAERALPEAA